VACQGKYKVNPEEGYSEPVNIWTIAALESGNRKSSVFKEATKPILKWEIEKGEALENEVKEAEIKKKNQEAVIKALRSKLAKAKPHDQMKIEVEILFKEANEIEVPKAEQKWTDDITPEQLGNLMAENDGRMAILSAEGGIFDMMAGRYSNGIPNLDIYLKGHAGDALRIERRSLPPVLIDDTLDNLPTRKKRRPRNNYRKQVKLPSMYTTNVSGTLNPGSSVVTVSIFS